MENVLFASRPAFVADAVDRKAAEESPQGRARLQPAWMPVCLHMSDRPEISAPESVFAWLQPRHVDLAGHVRRFPAVAGHAVETGGKADRTAER